MRKRSIQIIVRLDEGEHERFKSHVRKSGLSQEAYVRHLINGLVPTVKPPPDYFAMMNELQEIGAKLSASAPGDGRYDEAVAMLNRAIVDIVNAVMLPGRA